MHKIQISELPSVLFERNGPIGNGFKPCVYCQSALFINPVELHFSTGSRIVAITHLGVALWLVCFL